MKIFLERAIFINRAPLERLDLFFEEDEIAVLSGINGKGKTTILSHIVDAFHELAKVSFHASYEGIESKFYRITSGTFTLNSERPSVVYLIFKTSEKVINQVGIEETIISRIDYIDIRGKCNADEYEQLFTSDKKIPYQNIEKSLNTSAFTKSFYNFGIAQKKFDLQRLDDRKSIENIFKSNLLTNFPSYRYETPYYLNDPYKVKLQFALSSVFNGELPNPIDVQSCINEVANWILDLALDTALYDDDEALKVTEETVNQILAMVLSSKYDGNIKFGIAPRSYGSERIQIIKIIDDKPISIYRSIFSLSSGELALLCIFIELLRQTSKLNDSKIPNDVTGIVLIDEVDKHLHIKLQKEVLPKLLMLFPNVQFILSSHSPFLSLGLANSAILRSKIYDLDNKGIQVSPKNNEIYNEVFNMMVSENENFKSQLDALNAKIAVDLKPLIITEGKTDKSHLLKAIQKNNIQLDLSFYEVPTDFGSPKLKELLENISNLPQTKKIIGIFDRDEPKIVTMIETEGKSFKSFGNNVYAFCLPIPEHRKDCKNISIEHFYEDKDLKKEHNGKCLYFDNEVTHMSVSVANKRRTLIKLPEPIKEDELTKKIFDQHIGDIDWIHSKSVFADLIENNTDFSKDFNYQSFKVIFDRIQEVLDHQD